MSPDKTKQSVVLVRSIDDNTKRFFDAAGSLRQAAWQSFDARRAFEWKLSFGLWTALGAIIAGLAMGQATLKSMPERELVSAVVLMVVMLHAWWSFSLDQANRADLNKSYIFEREQRLALGISEQTAPGEDINKIIDAIAGRGWLASRWGHITQVAITFILSIGATALAWLR